MNQNNWLSDTSWMYTKHNGIPLLSTCRPSVARADRLIEDFRFPNRSSTCPGAVATNLRRNSIHVDLRKHSKG